MDTFIGTNITFTELTTFLIPKLKSSRIKVFDLRYFGSRIYGNPRPDSDIDVFISCHGASKPLFSLTYRKDSITYVIEIHAFEDFGDGYVPSYLLTGKGTDNQLKK